MNLLKTRIALTTCLIILTALPFYAWSSNCSATRPVPDSVPGAPGYVGKLHWYGSSELAALIPAEGKWTGRGAEQLYRDKFWWWAEGFDAKVDPFPTLDISARKTDNPSKKIVASRGASSYNTRWNAMFVLIRFPEAGCWEITGRYRDQELRFLLEVGE